MHLQWMSTTHSFTVLLKDDIYKWQSKKTIFGNDTFLLVITHSKEHSRVHSEITQITCWRVPTFTKCHYLHSQNAIIVMVMFVIFMAMVLVQKCPKLPPVFKFKSCSLLVIKGIYEAKSWDRA